MIVGSSLLDRDRAIKRIQPLPYVRVQVQLPGLIDTPSRVFHHQPTQAAGTIHTKHVISPNLVVFYLPVRATDEIASLRIGEPPRDKTNKMAVCPAKTQISLGIRPVWSESSLFAWRKLGSLATHWVHSKDSDQTRRMPRLIWVFAGRTVTLLVLSRGGSDVY